MHFSAHSRRLWLLFRLRSRNSSRSRLRLRLRLRRVAGDLGICAHCEGSVGRYIHPGLAHRKGRCDPGAARALHPGPVVGAELVTARATQLALHLAVANDPWPAAAACEPGQMIANRFRALDGRTNPSTPWAPGVKCCTSFRQHRSSGHACAQRQSTPVRSTLVYTAMAASSKRQTCATKTPLAPRRCYAVARYPR